MTLAEQIIKNILQELSKIRKYASFWESSDRTVKERGIACDLCESMVKNGETPPFSSPRTSEKDPPDCIAEDDKGNLVGIEITELVDEKTVRRNAQAGNAPWKFWQSNEIIKKIEQIISDKDKKRYSGGPYSRLILIIHTDEETLTFGDYHNDLSSYTFNSPETLDDVYLLFSYDPSYGRCPYIRLKFS